MSRIKKDPKAPEKKAPKRTEEEARRKRNEAWEKKHQADLVESARYMKEMFSKMPRGRTGRLTGIFLAIIETAKMDCPIQRLVGKKYIKMTDQEYAMALGEEELETSKEVLASRLARGAMGKKALKARDQAKIKNG